MPLECWPPTLEARCTFGMLLVLLGGSPRGWDVDCFAWGLGCGWSADHLASSLIALLGRRLFCSNSRLRNKDGRLPGGIVDRPSQSLIQLTKRVRPGALQVAGELAHDVTALGEGAAAGNADEVLGVVVGEEAARGPR